MVNGGTNQLPLRALSGLLPALVYIDYLKEAGVAVPQLQIIFADHISAVANHHINFEHATSESTKFARLAMCYIQALVNRSNGNGMGVYYGSAHLLVHDIALP